MRLGYMALAVVLGVSAPVAAFAQEGTVAGAAGGAVTGAVVGGPVGAAVGGVAGAVIGTAVAPPKEVRTYVVREQRPSIRYERELEVGATVPDDVEIYAVPDSDYSYTIVNEKRYIVSPKRKIVEVVN